MRTDVQAFPAIRDLGCVKDGRDCSPRGTRVLPRPDVVGAIGPDRWAEAWGAWSNDRAAEATIQRELAETLYAGGRLSTRVRDALVADAGKFDDMAVGS